MEAKIPGEHHRAVQGCAAEVQKPGDWVCIFVRCDEPRTPPSIHFSTSGPGIRGKIKLVIDDVTFTLSVVASSKSALALSTRAEVVPDNLLEAMKAGKVLSIEGTDLSPRTIEFPLRIRAGPLNPSSTSAHARARVPRAS